MSILNTIKMAVTSTAAEKTFLLGKHSPKILFAVGTAGFVGTVVLACRATMKLPKILDEYEYEIAEMKTALDAGEHGITQAEYDKAVRSEKFHTVGKVLKLYAIPVGVGALSIGALTGSHIVLSKQNAGLLATVKALETGYNQYRARVVADLGEEKDKEYAHGYKTEEVTETLSDGSTKVTKKKIYDPNGLSPFATMFSRETSSQFSDIPGENQLLLEMRQGWMTQKLQAQGHLFLNEAREMLGMLPVPEGQIVGWLSERHPDHKDGYINLGIFDANTSDDVRRFLNYECDEVMLDFNVDGTIWDKIGKRNPKL
jgi:hypothetical protein